MFIGESETFELKHTSYSRQVFAEGALKAAEYIVKQGNGLYNMKNIVKSWFWGRGKNHDYKIWKILAKIKKCVIIISNI